MNDQIINEIKDIEPDHGGSLVEGNNTTGGGSPEASEMVPRPRGRPPGSKNKATLFKELMTGHFEEKAIKDIERVYEVLFAEAHDGNMKAIKMVLDRVVPVTKAVDMDSLKGGISISVNVGSMEEARKAEVIDDAEYEEVEG